jgi:hypothetical protein
MSPARFTGGNIVLPLYSSRGVSPGTPPNQVTWCVGADPCPKRSPRSRSASCWPRSTTPWTKRCFSSCSALRLRPVHTAGTSVFWNQKRPHRPLSITAVQKQMNRSTCHLSKLKLLCGCTFHGLRHNSVTLWKSRRAASLLLVNRLNSPLM